MLLRLAPVAFVLLWSTGLIGSRLGGADAEPFTFLSIRFILAVLALALVALVRGTLLGPWRQRGRQSRRSYHALIGRFALGGKPLSPARERDRQGILIPLMTRRD